MTDKIKNQRAAGVLRSLTQRLSSASTKQLPILIPQVAKSLLDCKDILAVWDGSKKDSQEAVLLHKFKTQIITLLNHKTPAGRWAAVVLIKATVELGGHEVVAKAGPWVRGMQLILNKPDPMSTKKLCVVSMTRIFMSTHGNPALVREITTPSLPAFITSCLNAAFPKDPSLQSSPLRADFLTVVLSSFCRLLPNHSSIFRSFQTQLQGLLPLLLTTAVEGGNRPGDVTLSSNPDVVQAMFSLFSLLHLCSPKSGASNEYSRVLGTLIIEAHETVDQVFRAVREDWQSVAGVESKQVPTDGQPSSQTSNLGLEPWSGIFHGVERLNNLLQLIETFILSQTTVSVAFPLGPLVDLLIRICSNVVPTLKGDGAEVVFNEQVSKEERESLWSQLPSIHTAALEVMAALCSRLGAAVKPFHRIFIELITWIFGRESYNQALRVASYAAGSSILESSAGGLRKDQVRQLNNMIKTSCVDLLPAPADTEKDSTSFESALNMTAGDKSKEKATLASFPTARSLDLVPATSTFLTTLLSRVPAEHLPRSLRSQLDQAAILSDTSQLMLASVLNPSPHQPIDKAYSSILPFLARARPENLEVESLIRPRMPVVIGRFDRGKEDPNTADDVDSVDGSSLEENEDEMEVEGDQPSTEEVLDIELSGQNPESIGNEFGGSVPGSNIGVITETSGTASSMARSDAYPETDELNPQPRTETEKRVPLDEDALNPDPKRQRLDTTMASTQDVTLNRQPNSVAEASSVQNVEVKAAPTHAVDFDDEDSDDDFVVPELTLDPDTDDEDDED